MRGDALQRRVILGALAQLTTSLPGKIIGVVLTLLAARILTPHLYGEYGLAITIYGVSDLLTNPGAFTYFMRTPKTLDETLDSFWVIGLVRGAVLGALFWWLSPTLASLFDGSELLVLLLQMLSSIFLITAFKNPYVVKIYHDLDYTKIALLESLGGMLGNACGIFLLWATRSPAALILGSLIGTGVGVVLSWSFARKRPAWRFVMSDELREVWRFIRFLVINNIMIYLLLTLDDVFIGKMAGIAMLGFYSLSYKVANDSVLYLVTTLRKVLLPAFVKVFEEGNMAYVRAVTYKSVGLLSIVSWALTGLVAASSYEIMFYVAPDPKWRGAELVLTALMPFVFFRAVNGVYGSLLLAVGKPDALSRVSGLQLLGFLPLMWLGYELGMMGQTEMGTPLGGVLGVTLAIACLNLLSNLYLILIARGLFRVSLGRVMMLTWWGGMLVGFACAAAWATKFWLSWPLWVEGLLGAMVYMMVYLGAWQVLGHHIEVRYKVERPWTLLRQLRERKSFQET